MKAGSTEELDGDDCPAKTMVPDANRGSWLRRRSVWELFLQFFAVMLGVSVATMVNSCREQREAIAWDAKSLQGIANEVSSNLKVISENGAYYNAVAEQAMALMADKGQDVRLVDLTAFRGLNPIMLRSSAFQVRMQSPHGTAVADYALEEEIANLYSLQDWVLAGMDKWMYYIILHTDLFDMSVKDLGFIMKEWADMCRSLEAAYRELQADLPESIEAR